MEHYFSDGFNTLLKYLKNLSIFSFDSQSTLNTRDKLACRMIAHVQRPDGPEPHITAIE